MNSGKTRVYLRQGSGEDQLYVPADLSPEELGRMTELKTAQPDRWRHRELDLLEEVRRLLGQQPEKEAQTRQEAQA